MKWNWWRKGYLATWIKTHQLNVTIYSEPTCKGNEIKLIIVQQACWHKSLGHNTRQGTPKQVRSSCMTGHKLIVLPIYLGIYVCVICNFCCHEESIEDLHYLWETWQFKLNKTVAVNILNLSYSSTFHKHQLCKWGWILVSTQTSWTSNILFCYNRETDYWKLKMEHLWKDTAKKNKICMHIPRHRKISLRIPSNMKCMVHPWRGKKKPLRVLWWITFRLTVF